MQVWQFIVGAHVAVRTWPALLASEGWLEMERCQSDLRGMRGTFLCGCIYAYMAVMNFINTAATITDKASHDGRRGAHAKRGRRGAAGGAAGAAAAAGAGAEAVAVDGGSGGNGSEQKGGGKKKA